MLISSTDALTMKDVIAQLDSLGKTFQQLFGVIGTSLPARIQGALLTLFAAGGVNSKDEFEALFITHEEEGSQEDSEEERSNSSTDTEDERRTQ